MSQEPAGPPPRLLDQVAHEVRVRHYSRRTEEAYCGWVRRFILFHGKRHPAMMGEPEVARYLTWLATERRVSPNTQSQALSALLFLYRDVLRQEVGWVHNVVRAKPSRAAAPSRPPTTPPDCRSTSTM